MNEPVFDEFAWAVGLFEGEGCIDTVSSPNGRRRVYARVRLTTTDEDVADRFARVAQVGRTYLRGPSNTGHKPQFVWECAGHAASQFLQRVLPHLGDRRQARAIEALTEAGLIHDDAQEVLRV